MGMQDLHKKLLRILVLALKPVIRLCLKRSMYIQDLTEALKIAFIETAIEEIERLDQEVTISRLRVMTGIHRKDILRIHREGGTQEASAGFVTRIIGTWLNNKKYCSKPGKPRVLSFETEDSEFSQLVLSISTDVHPSSAVFELERLELVEKTSRGLSLKMNMYMPSNDPVKIYELYARDASYLMDSVQENALDKPGTANLHIMTEYDNIPAEDLPSIRKWIITEGSKFHKKVRDYLSSFDLDLNPKARKAGGSKMVVGSFSCSYPKESTNKS